MSPLREKPGFTASPGDAGNGSPSPQVSWYKSVNLSSAAIVDVNE